MPKIDTKTAPSGSGTRYPAPYDEPCKERRFLRLGEAAGLTKIGVNLVTMPPGTWSSQRHWHALEDEFLYVVSGELVLITDAGETIMQEGDCAGFPAGVEDGHHLQNRSQTDASFIVVSNRDNADHGEYSDIDMQFHPPRYPPQGSYTRKDGSPI